MQKSKQIIKKIVLFLILSVQMINSGCSGKPQPPEQPVKQVETVQVKMGIDNIDKHLSLFSGKRVGLITNSTGINSQYQSTVDVLYSKINLVALFAPEHGIRGNVPAGAKVNTYPDKKTGLPVYSLYGKTKKPTADMLANIDMLVFDIQDVGARPYTYIYTMAYAMESCREMGKQFVVLDRPNPVGGVEVEGGVIKKGYESFIGLYPIPSRHGLTIGELAKLFNTEYGIDCDLTVIEMSGWRRDMLFIETGLPWIMTSPNIPTPDTALVYSGIGLFGGTNISDGVGTTRPFDFVGAPWIDADDLAGRVNKANLPGVVFRPAYFTPRFGDLAGENCGGVQLHVTDRKTFRPLKTGLTLLYVIKEIDEERFKFKTNAQKHYMIDWITGDNALSSGKYSLAELLTIWEDEAKQFKAIAKKYYIYN